MITSNNLRSEQDALIYMVECTLATVEDLAGRSRPPKHETERQISIAQTGLNWARTIEDRSRSPRVDRIIESGLSVHDWVYQPRG